MGSLCPGKCSESGQRFFLISVRQSKGVPHGTHCFKYLVNGRYVRGRLRQLCLQRALMGGIRLGQTVKNRQ